MSLVLREGLRPESGNFYEINFHSVWTFGRISFAWLLRTSPSFTPLRTKGEPSDV